MLHSLISPKQVIVDYRQAPDALCGLSPHVDSMRGIVSYQRGEEIYANTDPTEHWYCVISGASRKYALLSDGGHPGIYDPAMADALVAAEMPFGDTIPAGTYIDMAANLPLVDPTQVKSPVLMTRGEWDGNSTDDDLLDFFRQLPSGDRQYVILPNTPHSQGFSKNRELLWYVMKNFLAEPLPVAS